MPFETVLMYFRRICSFLCVSFICLNRILYRICFFILLIIFVDLFRLVLVFVLLSLYHRLNPILNGSRFRLCSLLDRVFLIFGNILYGVFILAFYLEFVVLDKFNFFAFHFMIMIHRILLIHLFVIEIFKAE